MQILLVFLEWQKKTFTDAGPQQVVVYFYSVKFVGCFHGFVLKVVVVLLLGHGCCLTARFRPRSSALFSYKSKTSTPNGTETSE